MAAAQPSDLTSPKTSELVILSTGALAAPLGWLAGSVTNAGPTGIGTATGALAGLLGVRPQCR